MTKSVTVIFPGQGAQYVGMAKNLKPFQCYEFLEKADRALEQNISTLMTEGPQEELSLTANTQPAILAHSMALYHRAHEILSEKNVSIDRVLGHSVGEYAALVAAKSIDFEDAVRMVHLRGKFMQEAVPVGKGKMLAVLKISEEKVRQCCEEVSTNDSIVSPANFNSPGQIVISGDAIACDRASLWFEKNIETPFRVMELKVSAPFHSTLMKPAAEKLKLELDNIEIQPTKLPYIANIDAKEYDKNTSPEKIRENLYRQVDGNVLWTHSIQSLPDNTICVECGPGKVLAGLIKKINKNIKVVSLDRDNGLLELQEILS